MQEMGLWFVKQEYELRCSFMCDQRHCNHWFWLLKSDLDVQRTHLWGWLVEQKLILSFSLWRDLILWFQQKNLLDENEAAKYFCLWFFAQILAEWFICTSGFNTAFFCQWCDFAISSSCRKAAPWIFVSYCDLMSSDNIQS